MDLLTVFERVAANKRREICFLNHEVGRTSDPARLQKINALIGDRLWALDELSKKIKSLEGEGHEKSF